MITQVDGVGGWFPVFFTISIYDFYKITEAITFSVYKTELFLHRDLTSFGTPWFSPGEHRRRKRRIRLPDSRLPRPSPAGGTGEPGRCCGPQDASHSPGRKPLALLPRTVCHSRRLSPNPSSKEGHAREQQRGHFPVIQQEATEPTPPPP